MIRPIPLIEYMEISFYVYFFALVLVCTSTEHTLLGHWTFEEGEELVDLTGHFEDVMLKSAVVEDGHLDVGDNKWAVTGVYTGPSISEKTLVSWAFFDDFAYQAGSVLTIDKLSADEFDAIVFGEITSNKWMAGSSYFRRTIDPSPGYTETKLGHMFQIAITYQNSGGSARVRLYRNGELIGDYTKGYLATWPSGDAEMFWGLRHGSTSGGPGDLDAHIEESRLYAGVLTSEELRELYPQVDRVKCSANVSDGDIKLDNSTTPPLVMMCTQGKWGYICGSDETSTSTPWTFENTGISCLQLGYVKQDSYMAPAALDEQISVVYPVHYSFMYCMGTEGRLINCPHGGTNVHHGSCKVGSSYKYGVATCTKKPIVCNTPGEVKIVNTTVLQICSQGEWYTICGDVGVWSNTHAAVACRQLGLNPIGALGGSASLDGITNNLATLFHCTGSEESLLDCSSTSLDQCMNKASIVCGEKIEISTSMSSSSSSQVPQTAPATKTVTIIQPPDLSTTTSITPSTSSTMSSRMPRSTTKGSSQRTSETSSVAQCSNVERSVGGSSALGSYSWLLGLFIGLIVGLILGIGIACIVYVINRRKSKLQVDTYMYRKTGAKNLSDVGKEYDEASINVDNAYALADKLDTPKHVLQDDDDDENYS